MDMFCCVPECTPNANYFKHKFPDPRTEVGLFHFWLQKVSNVQLMNMSEDWVFDTFRVCDKHFAECDHNQYRKIRKNAFPKLFLPPQNRCEMHQDAFVHDHTYCVESKPINGDGVLNDHTYYKNENIDFLLSDTPEMELTVDLRGKIHSCKFCPFSTSSTFSTVQHVKHHQKGLQPFICHQDIEVYKCIQCSFTTDTLTSFKKHIQSHVKKSDLKDFNQLYVCRICNFISHFLLKWYQHVTQDCHFFKKNLEPYRCKKCKFTTLRLLVFKKHLSSSHLSQDEMKLLQCEACSYQTTSLNRLRLHKRKHFFNDTLPNIHPFKCDKCGFASKWRHSLENHMDKHYHPSKKFKCDECSYEAKQNRYLKEHVRRKHSKFAEIDKFECPTCPYKTKWKQNLRQHRIARHLKVIQRSLILIK